MGKAPVGKAPVKPVKRAAAKSAAASRGKAVKGRAPAPAAAKPLISSSSRMLLILVGIAFVPFCLPTLLLLFVGMLPTLAAAFMERGSARQAWVSVGGLNFAGLSNWLLSLWFGHHTLSYAIGQLTTITPLLVAYAASAMGWALYLAMPPLVNAITSVTSQRRVITLAAEQRKLVEQWGDEVIARENGSKTAPPSPVASSAPAAGSV
jgi:hypothetical protein